MQSAVIPAYVYQQYADDADVQAFFSNYNTAAQQFLTWFATVGLPVYTGLSGSLLDWVGVGLYGIPRPTLGNALVSDDVYQRCMTWALYKGDGTLFNIRWLKRRIMRFLEGTNGTDPGVNQTYQISVRFGSPNIVYINILGGIAQIVGGAIFNDFAFNTKAYNELDLNIQHYADTTLAVILKEAIDARVVELPFQFQYVVSVNP
jgi:hypothetical protein